LEIDPNNRGALNNLSDIERDQKETDAVNKIKTTGELLKEGQSSMTKGKYKLAVKLYLKAYGAEPLLKNAVNLAGAYKKMGKFDRIEKLYKQFITDNTQDNIETIDNEFKFLRMNEKVMAK
jgi:tetratricopeptide (TPR) repeat protein